MHLSIVKVPYWLLDWLSIIFSCIFNFKPSIFYQTLRLLFICVGLYIFSETITSECSTFHRAPHIYWFSYAHEQGPAVDRETVYFYILVGPSELNEPSTRRLTLDFTGSHRFSPMYTHFTWRNCICQHSVITETTVRQRPLALIWFRLPLGKPLLRCSRQHARHRDTSVPHSN